MNFASFASKLDEVREYRSGNQYWYFLNYYLRQPGASGTADLISQDESVFLADHFRATHIVHAADTSGLNAVEAAFSLTLPDDMKEFYARWHQVLLVLREAYWIMPAEEVISTNKGWRGPHDEKFPCNLLRFARCFDSEGQHFALRRKAPDAEWTVAMIDDDDYHVDEADAGTELLDWRVTDPSFTAWLKRMLETDGTPWFPGNEEECKTIRVA